jgi:hypothetical protein
MHVHCTCPIQTQGKAGVDFGSPSCTALPFSFRTTSDVTAVTNHATPPDWLINAVEDESVLSEISDLENAALPWRFSRFIVLWRCGDFRGVQGCQT